MSLEGDYVRQMGSICRSRWLRNRICYPFTHWYSSSHYTFPGIIRRDHLSPRQERYRVSTSGGRASWILFNLLHTPQKGQWLAAYPRPSPLEHFHCCTPFLNDYTGSSYPTLAQKRLVHSHRHEGRVFSRHNPPLSQQIPSFSNSDHRICICSYQWLYENHHPSSLGKFMGASL